MEEELSSLTLFKMVNPPIDISSFTIITSPNGGIDLDKISEEVNMDVEKEHLLAMLHTLNTNPRAVDEQIESSVY